MNRELLLSLVGKSIRVDRGGPESRVGMLLAVEGDYLVLYTKDDGVVYYNLQHIKSVTVDSKGLMNVEVPENVEFFQGTDFKNVISNFSNSWIKVNRGGPEALEGILKEVEATNDYITVFSKQDVVYLAMFHIRNISFGVKKEEPEKEEGTAQTQEGRANARANKRKG